MAEKSERASVTGIVRRAFPVQLEVRAKAGASGLSTISGYASVVDEPYEMWDFLGSYSEVVRSGAFTKTLSETPQVQLLLNHGGLAMAYTKAGSLRLAEDSTGLHMEADVTAARSDVQDMLLALQDGSVDEMSFAFRVTRQMWSPDYDQRDIIEVDLHRGDVSVVNFGANPATSVAPALRAADFDKLGDDDARALMERLQRRFAPPVTPAQPAGHPLSLYQAQAAALSL
ncbi:HK97 family phage prohead protease [Streptomyces sp. NPDC047079]|uniref:HK97 family phage prohead protease n=1 Tax=Streptomyces sp. NPDC047079 TaxID=3154607 RepID=UPI0034062E3B